MIEETTDPKESNNSNNDSKKIEKAQINEQKNYSDRFGDAKIKNEGHYAKPVINDSIVQKPSEDKGSSNDTTKE